MRVRDWQDVLAAVVDESAPTEGWRAVGGSRAAGVGEDLYVGHPSAGVYHLKTYARNPREVDGVGARVARKIDGDLDSLFPDDSTDDRFAVQTPPADEGEARSTARQVEETLKVHSDAPTEPEDLFVDLMDAIGSPAFGPMTYEMAARPDPLDDFASTFAEAEATLNAELDDSIQADGVGRGFR